MKELKKQDFQKGRKTHTLLCYVTFTWEEIRIMITLNSTVMGKTEGLDVVWE